MYLHQRKFKLIYALKFIDNGHKFQKQLFINALTKLDLFLNSKVFIRD